MKSRALLAAATTCTVLASALLTQCSPAAARSLAAAEGAVFRTERGALDITLTENGAIVAKDSQKLTFKIKGQGRITFLVPEGTEVEEGEVV